MVVRPKRNPKQEGRVVLRCFERPPPQYFINDNKTSYREERKEGERSAKKKMARTKRKHLNFMLWGVWRRHNFVV